MSFFTQLLTHFSNKIKNHPKANCVSNGWLLMSLAYLKIQWEQRLPLTTPDLYEIICEWSDTGFVKMVWDSHQRQACKIKKSFLFTDFIY